MASLHALLTPLRRTRGNRSIIDDDYPALHPYSADLFVQHVLTLRHQFMQNAFKKKFASINCIPNDAERTKTFVMHDVLPLQASLKLQVQHAPPIYTRRKVTKISWFESARNGTFGECSHCQF